MKLNMKAIAASVLFAVAGSSQAAIQSGFSQAGDGELFISIFRDNASPQSMIIDTNTSLLGLRDGSVTGWTSDATQTAAILNFLNSAPLASFVFNAGGVTDVTDIFDPTSNADLGFFVTTNDTLTPTTPPLSSAGMETARSNINAYEVTINNAYTTTEVISGINLGDPGYHDTTNLWSDNIGGGFSGQQTEVAVGTAANLWNAYNADTQLFGYAIGYNVIGQLNIDPQTGVASLTTGSVSTVPVPAAAWLFGSGVVGMVGVARRRSKA
jgi:hypothetical protein